VAKRGGNGGRVGREPGPQGGRVNYSSPGRAGTAAVSPHGPCNGSGVIETVQPETGNVSSQDCEPCRGSGRTFWGKKNGA
jgi:hypothetical protein